MAALPLITAAALVDDLAERTGWSKSDVRVFLQHLEDFTLESVAAGTRVKLPGGVVVGAVVRGPQKARMGRNPATGEAIEISAKPASTKVKASLVKPMTDVELPSVKKLGGGNSTKPKSSTKKPKQNGPKSSSKAAKKASKKSAKKKKR